SISRSRARARGWGIGVPGDPAQIVYVWFDALANYVSALGYGTNAEPYRELWESSDRRIHVIGKNLTRFHCVYWPGILASAGVVGPTDVVVHGFLTVGGRKIGKSLGNSSGAGLDPFELLEQVGRDRLRYYLLGQFPLGKDGDFSVPALVRACNAGLSDQLGNLLQRTLRLLEQSCGARIPPPRGGRSPLAEQALEAARRISVQLDAAAPDRALCTLDELVQACNLFVSRSEPWRIARSARESTNGAERRASAAQLELVLGEVASALLWIGGLLEPFLPAAAARLAHALGAPLPNPYRAPEQILWGELGAGAGVRPGDVLFPRLALP
ncbi:MAG TPA: class I tRNA ligase family protein, partial [Polyangiaceae bacterium]|nr:class I tRNA ligase family protein [Polyangiaceae bacterium]